MRFARKPLWDVGCDYDHGTGHGVGSYLSVHEGPQNISKRPVTQPLKPGMICSNEPGYYKDRRIRHPHREPDRGDGGQARSRRRSAAQVHGIRDHHARADRPRSGRAEAADRRTSATGSTPITRACARRCRRWSMTRRARGWRRRQGRFECASLQFWRSACCLAGVCCPLGERAKIQTDCELSRRPTRWSMRSSVFNATRAIGRISWRHWFLPISQLFQQLRASTMSRQRTV